VFLEPIRESVGLGYVDQCSGFVGADLVEENGWVIAYYDMAMIGGRQHGVDELQPDKVRSNLRFLINAAFAKIGGVAVGGYS
jgi:hypothetical protein